MLACSTCKKIILPGKEMQTGGKNPVWTQALPLMDNFVITSLTHIGQKCTWAWFLKRAGTWSLVSPPSKSPRHLWELSQNGLFWKWNSSSYLSSSMWSRTLHTIWVKCLLMLSAIDCSLMLLSIFRKSMFLFLLLWSLWKWKMFYCSCKMTHFRCTLVIFCRSFVSFLTYFQGP